MIDRYAIELFDEGVLAVVIFYLLSQFRKAINENTGTIKELRYFLEHQNGKRKRR